MNHKIEINTDKCIGCGLCVEDCPMNNINKVDKKANLISNDCIKCGHCVAICPKYAVTMSGFEEEPIEITRKANIDSDELLLAMQARRTIRHFIDKPVEKAKLNKIIEAARWTPTGKNAKSVSFVILQDKKDEVEKLAVKLFRKVMPMVSLFYPPAKGRVIDDAFFFKGAPLVISVVSKDKVSATLAAGNMALMAESQSLGVLYSGFFCMAANMSIKIKKAMKLQSNKVVVALVIGYPKLSYKRSTQKENAEVHII